MKQLWVNTAVHALNIFSTCYFFSDNYPTIYFIH